MIELRCPACSRANAVRDDASLNDVRCAACMSDLDGRLRVRYRVGGLGSGWGAQLFSDLQFRAEGGSLTRSMLLSEENGPWVRAGERADLFQTAGHAPRATAQVPQRALRASGMPRSRATPAKAPSAIATMATLGQLLGVLILLIAVGGFFVAASLGAEGSGMLVFLFLVALGWGQLAIASGLRRGSSAARSIQLAFAVGGGVIYLLAAADGAPPAFLLFGGLFVATPFLLLFDPAARAWCNQ